MAPCTVWQKRQSFSAETNVAISSRSPGDRLCGPCSRMLASSLSGLAVSGRKAIGPRIPGRPSGRGMCGIVVLVGREAALAGRSVADVAARGQPLALLAVRLVRHLGDARRGDPAVVEVEQRAGGDRVVDRLVVPTGGLH